MATTRQRSNGRKQDENGEKKGPVFSRRAFTGSGSVEVAVFDKMVTAENGEFRVFNVVVKRTWKNGDVWESGNSFRPEDIGPLTFFLQDAFLFIADEQAKR